MPADVRRLIPTLLFAFTCPACSVLSLPTLLGKNLDAIQASTAAISHNNDIVKDSTAVSEQGIKSFERLRQPMESMSGLAPTLQAVAALNQPLTEVAGLGSSLHEVAGLERPMSRLGQLQPSLDRTAALGPSMDRLAAMRPSLDAVASLGDPLVHVAALQPQLAAVADLSAPMTDLTALREPLERVADLRDPMTRLARLGTAMALVNHPMLLALAVCAGLVLWGGVTFVAVRLAILSVAGGALARR